MTQRHGDINDLKRKKIITAAVDIEEISQQMS